MNKNNSTKQHFAVCLNNKNYEASLEVGKLYRVIPDERAGTHGYIRVVDESGEDYAFTADRFLLLELSPQVEETLFAVL